MRRQLKSVLGAVVVMNLVSLAAPGQAQAGGFGDVFNPSRWFGGNRGDGYYGHGGPYGYGGPGYYGGPYGYGGPGYGWPGHYGYGAPYGYPPSTTVIQVPAQGGESKAPPPKVPE